MIRETPKTGDVWLVRVPYVKKAKLVAFLIGLFQRPVERYGEVMSYGHAGVFTGRNRRNEAEVIEATGKGIVTSWVQLDHRDHELWKVSGITDVQRQIVVNAARKKLGQSYGWIDLISAGRIRTSRSVCSELVAESLGVALIEIDGWTPNHLARSACLQRT